MTSTAPARPLLYLISQYPAGPHTFIRREILALERQGHEVVRVSVRRWSGKLVDPQDISEEARTTYILEARWLALLASVAEAALMKPGAFAKAVWEMLRIWWPSDRPLALHVIYLIEACWLSKYMKGVSPRHLHAHFGTNPAEVAMLTHLISGVPYSFTVHGYDEFDKPVALGLQQKIEHAKFVAAISSYGRSQLMRWARVADWAKIAVVRCGIDQSFYDTPAVAPEQANQFVSIGRLCKEKAQLILLDALALLVKEGVDARLVFVGDGDLRPELEQRIAELSLGDRVRITGWVGSPDVRKELLDSVALAHPSFADGLPVAVMEAMALRRPVIACYIAGTPELVEDGQTGWLVPASSLDQLADRMRQCLALPEDKRAEMGERGRARVLVQHQIDSEAAKLAQLFAN